MKSAADRTRRDSAGGIQQLPRPLLMARRRSGRGAFLPLEHSPARCDLSPDDDDGWKIFGIGSRPFAGFLLALRLAVVLVPSNPVVPALDVGRPGRTRHRVCGIVAAAARHRRNAARTSCGTDGSCGCASCALAWISRVRSLRKQLDAQLSGNKASAMTQHPLTPAMRPSLSARSKRLQPTLRPAEMVNGVKRLMVNSGLGHRAWRSVTLAKPSP